MTQDERWQAQYDQMMTFMNENHRRPSKHRLEEHDMLNWYKHVKKAIAKGNYPPHRIEKFALLQQVANKYRRKNQYKQQVYKPTNLQVYKPTGQQVYELVVRPVRHVRRVRQVRLLPQKK